MFEIFVGVDPKFGKTTENMFLSDDSSSQLRYFSSSALNTCQRIVLKASIGIISMCTDAILLRLRLRHIRKVCKLF